MTGKVCARVGSTRGGGIVGARAKIRARVDTIAGNFVIRTKCG